ncbi:nitrite reductase small subunit NirD [Thalassobacillus pellis]|uniref:nitrite reductase small subunit NirD n=1 Tax=Thalassobacillus pellis TaxID=748008 RepID=UPI00195F7E79|nr:nitrite reductase small subunit NirD [Thalassobacillus pellis]MBM7553367.1 nitrite reductase (NADH) small subunit [Thalassobacillus pellis]
MQQLTNKVFVAKASELPDKLGKTVQFRGMELAIFKLAGGKVKAIENRCPHKGGVLAEGMVSGEHVFCPMHDWKINISDGKVQAPDHGCVQTYQVEVEDDNIFVMLPDGQ